MSLFDMPRVASVATRVSLAVSCSPSPVRRRVAPDARSSASTRCEPGSRAQSPEGLASRPKLLACARTRARPTEALARPHVQDGRLHGAGVLAREPRQPSGRPRRRLRPPAGGGRARRATGELGGGRDETGAVQDGADEHGSRSGDRPRRNAAHRRRPRGRPRSSPPSSTTRPRTRANIQPPRADLQGLCSSARRGSRRRRRRAGPPPRHSAMSASGAVSSDRSSGEGLDTRPPRAAPPSAPSARTGSARLASQVGHPGQPGQVAAARSGRGLLQLRRLRGVPRVEELEVDRPEQEVRLRARTPSASSAGGVESRAAADGSALSAARLPGVRDQEAVRGSSGSWWCATSPAIRFAWSGRRRTSRRGALRRRPDPQVRVAARSTRLQEEVECPRRFAERVLDRPRCHSSRAVSSARAGAAGPRRAARLRAGWRPAAGRPVPPSPYQRGGVVGHGVGGPLPGVGGVGAGPRWPRPSSATATRSAAASSSVAFRSLGEVPRPGRASRPPRGAQACCERAVGCADLRRLAAAAAEPGQRMPPTRVRTGTASDRGGRRLGHAPRRSDGERPGPARERAATGQGEHPRRRPASPGQVASRSRRPASGSVTGSERQRGWRPSTCSALSARGDLHHRQRVAAGRAARVARATSGATAGSSLLGSSSPASRSAEAADGRLTPCRRRCGRCTGHRPARPRAAVAANASASTDGGSSHWRSSTSTNAVVAAARRASSAVPSGGAGAPGPCAQPERDLEGIACGTARQPERGRGETSGQSACRPAKGMSRSACTPLIRTDVASDVVRSAAASEDGVLPMPGLAEQHEAAAPSGLDPGDEVPQERCLTVAADHDPNLAHPGTPMPGIHPARRTGGPTQGGRTSTHHRRSTS